MIDKSLEGYVSGIVTVANWTAMPNGKLYLYLFSRSWLIVTDKGMAQAANLERFKSTEGWQIVSVMDGEVQVLIPGCQVKGFAACTSTPLSPEIAIYDLGVR